MRKRLRPSGRRLSIFLVPALLTVLVAPLPASALSGSTRATAGASSKGELYPNFAAQGSNLIRLQAGAFDLMPSLHPQGSRW
jgi:hypothetical protein